MTEKEKNGVELLLKQKRVDYWEKFHELPPIKEFTIAGKKEMII